MLKIIIFCVLLVFICYVTYVSCAKDSLLAKGKWLVINIELCNDDGVYENKINIKKSKYNRTTDVFDFKLILIDEISISHGLYLKICKIVDGGCKPYQELSDNSLENFVKKYAKDNFYRLLEIAGGEVKDFPLPPGIIEGSNYVFNYDELPEDGPIGEYMIESYVTQGGQKVACIKSHVVFMDIEEWEDAQNDDE